MPHGSRVVAKVLGACAALLCAWLTASAHDGGTQPLPRSDRGCLGCHADAAGTGPHSDDARPAPPIVRRAYARSVHAHEGCLACHPGADAAEHGRAAAPLAGARDRAHAANAICRDCHAQRADAYRDSVHARLVLDGNAEAPLCSHCHDPHASPAMAARAEPVACARCHAAIARAYADSVHGSHAVPRLDCVDCHRSHRIEAASFGAHLRDACLECHPRARAAHGAWLPNAALHLDTVACAACHVPGARRRVDLRLHAGADPRQASERFGVPLFMRHGAAAGEGLDARALWSLLQDFNRGGQPKTVLRGRLQLREGTDAHRLAPKTAALADCATCHRAGTDSFAGVTISVAGPDGRPLRHDAQPGLLQSVRSIESVGGFYAIGATRIGWLDALLALAVAAGAGLPALHVAARLRRRARRRAGRFAATPRRRGAHLAPAQREGGLGS